MSENICVINAQSGIGTSSPQISQFSHNCDSIKFIINKDLTGFALCLISSINGDVSVIPEGEYLSKAYNDETKETTVLWYPSAQITSESGCVLYQLAAYEAEGKNAIWYSKEGRLIVSDSIDTDDFSAKQVGSEPNLVTQLITKIKSLELDITSLESTKVDKEEAAEEKEKLQKLHSNFDETKENFEERFELAEADIKNLSDVVEENKGEETYNPESIKSQSGKAVAQALAALVNSAPETLNTLDELAKALGNDPNFATTIMTLLGKKVDKIEGKVLSSNDFTDEYRQTVDENSQFIGELTYLNTDAQNTLVDAINEVYELGPKDLGTFEFYASDEGDMESFSEALDNVKSSGVYKLRFYDPENEYESDAILIVTQSNMDNIIQIMITPRVLGNHRRLTFPIFRTYTWNEDINDYVWTPWNDALSTIENKIDKSSITNNFEDIWSKDSEELIPTAQVLSFFVSDERVAYSVDDIEGTEDIVIPTVETALELFRPYPITEIPITLSENKQYNFGEVTSLSLAFPTYADDGAVIYLTFYSGAAETSLTIDTTNTCDIEFVPEKNTGYEVFGKFNGSIWIVNYSEYMVSEG